MKWELRTQLKKLHADFGHTMIYVTHDQTEALTFADKVVVMHGGRVVQIGTPQELFEAPAHTFVGYFIGSPGMNLFDAHLDGSRAQIAGATVDLGHSYAASGTTQVGVRPEFIRLGSGGNGIPARVTRVEDVGRHQIVRLETAGGEISAIAAEGAAIPASIDRVRFAQGSINIYADDWRVAPHEGAAA
jgi:glycerol transport system ATP-binding protein